MYRQSEKNLLSGNISSTCPHNMVNFGPLVAEIVSLVWGTPANFNSFRVLASLLHGTLVLGVSQTLWRWTEAPSIFRRAAITLGIGPHYSCVYFVCIFASVRRTLHIIVNLWYLVTVYFDAAKSCSRTVFVCVFIMAALWNRAGHYIFALWFLSIYLSFFSSPNLSRRRLDVYHISTHGVALVQI